MLLALFAWLVGGLAFMAGCRWLLHVKRARFDHEERMAEIALDRARLDEEVAQARAERAHRTRPDLAEVLAALDAPTEVFAPVPAAPETAAELAVEPGGPVEVEPDIDRTAEAVADLVDDRSADDPASYEAVVADSMAGIDWPVEQPDVEEGRHRLPTLS